jgi:hypothetical protein
LTNLIEVFTKAGFLVTTSIKLIKPVLVTTSIKLYSQICFSDHLY